MKEGVNISIEIRRRAISHFCFVTDDESMKVWLSMTLQQKNAIVFIAGKMDSDGRVNMSGKNKDDMMSVLKIKRGRFYQLLRQLTKLSVISKDGGGDYLVNNRMFFKEKNKD